MRETARKTVRHMRGQFNEVNGEGASWEKNEKKKKWCGMVQSEICLKVFCLGLGTAKNKIPGYLAEYHGIPQQY